MLEIIEILKNGGTIEAGTYEKMVTAGYFPMHLNLHLKIYYSYRNYYEVNISNNTKSPNQLAITHTADDYSVSEMTVRRAINSFK